MGSGNRKKMGGGGGGGAPLMEDSRQYADSLRKYIIANIYIKNYIFQRA